MPTEDAIFLVLISARQSIMNFSALQNYCPWTNILFRMTALSILKHSILMSVKLSAILLMQQ